MIGEENSSDRGHRWRTATRLDRLRHVEPRGQRPAGEPAAQSSVLSAQPHRSVRRLAPSRRSRTASTVNSQILTDCYWNIMADNEESKSDSKAEDKETDATVS